jgi:hypothetical protein
MGIKNKILGGIAILVVTLGTLVAIPTGFSSVAVSAAIAIILVVIIAKNIVGSKI